MEAYLVEVRKIEKQFSGLELQHVPRGTNKEADDIARRASKRLPQEPGIFEERLFKPLAAPHPRGWSRLGRSSLHHQPREPPPVARPQERACSWHWSLMKDAGSQSSGAT